MFDSEAKLSESMSVQVQSWKTTLLRVLEMIFLATFTQWTVKQEFNLALQPP